MEQLASVEFILFDFDGVFTDNSVYVDQNGVESVRCWRSDGLGLSRLGATGVKLAIISTETNPVVAARAKKLNLPVTQGVEDKALAVEQICREYRVAPEATMFVGNDINDIPAFEKIGFPVAVADAYPEVDSHVIYKTSKKGGYGAVREICDLIFVARREQTRWK